MCFLFAFTQISGTAAKLGHPNAYHHCTLLACTNKQNLGDALVKEQVTNTNINLILFSYMKYKYLFVFFIFLQANYISKATASIPSPIRNLCDVNRKVNVPQLLSAVGYEFLRTSATKLEDGGNAQTMQQRGFQLINPTEKWFPGIREIRDEYGSWDWIYGKTPKFSVEKDLYLKADDKEYKITLCVEVDKVCYLFFCFLFVYLSLSLN